jgi:N-acetylglucosamine-6-phosphate deacetylase
MQNIMKLDGYKIFRNDGTFHYGSVEFGKRIMKVEYRDDTMGDAITASDGYLIPGLVDIHSHGAMGFDHSDGNPDDLAKTAQYYARNGVTSFLATTITSPEETLLKAASVIGEHTHKRPGNGARLLGINMEGPFLSCAKRGAHKKDLLIPPNAEFFLKLYKASNESIRIVTVAPELEGSLDFIRDVTDYTKVSLGHTEADYNTAARAFEAGADHVTHLYNAMPPFLHRNPGLIGAALDANAYVELITDGIHVHPAAVRASFRMFPDRVCLISDSIRSAGLPDGEYTSGGQSVTVADGKVTLKDGTIAGSNISLSQGLRYAVRFGVSLEDAVLSATHIAAKSIGLSDVVGSIAVGTSADMVLLNSDLTIKKVFIEGEDITL